MPHLQDPAARARLPLATVLTDPPEPFIHRCVVVLGWLMRRLTRVDWRHADRIPSHGGAVVVVNHISNADFLTYGHFLAWSGRWPRFLAKAELFDTPVLGWVLRSAHQIRVDRDSDSARAAVTAAERAVRRGQVVSVYPEGTITADPDGWPMTPRTGAARIALGTGCPVVPVGQWGAQELMPGRRLGLPRLWRRPTSRVLVGPEVDLDDLRSRPVSEETVREASARLIEAVTALVGELRQQVPPTRPWDLRTGARVDLRAHPVPPPDGPGPAAEDGAGHEDEDEGSRP